jgi:serine/threonine-protein kinase ATR
MKIFIFRDLIYSVCKNYYNALMLGSKYVYEMLPRVLTLWMDLGEEVWKNEKDR